MKTLVVKVKTIEDYCNTHKIGDGFRLEGGKLSFPRENKYVCIYALSSLLPLLPAKQRKWTSQTIGCQKFSKWNVQTRKEE